MEIEAIPRSQTFPYPLLENSFNPFSFTYFWYIAGGLAIVILLVLCCFCIRCCYKSNSNLTNPSRLLPVPQSTISSPNIRNLYTPSNPFPPLQPFSSAYPLPSNYYSNTMTYSPLDRDIIPKARNRTHSMAEPEREMDNAE